MAPEPATNPQFNTQRFATDRQIDQLGYQLYGLTDAEIRIVEGATVKGTRGKFLGRSLEAPAMFALPIFAV